MRLEVQALITGDFIIDESITVKSHPYDITISKGENGYCISISKRVFDYMEYITKYLGKRNKIPQFKLTPYEFYEDMILWLQYIESMGSFNFAVEKISWEEPKITWIPESDEEQGIMPLLSFQKNYDKKKNNRKLKHSSLSMLVIHRRFLKDIHIPFTYFRQGKSLLDQRQYYFAFINFFMMLEYCFANGKFKKEAVIKEFSQSYLLNKSINSALDLIKKGEAKSHFEWIQKECIQHNKAVDNKGVVYILLKYRGLLSHASKYSDKYLFNDSQLFSLAFITSMICFLVCGNLQIGNCLFGKQKDEYLYGTDIAQK